MEFLLHILILIVFYAMLSQSLNLSAGYTGLISLSHAGFYGIGAYTTAILSLKYSSPFWINLPVAMLLTGLIAALVSLIALRTAEDYFIICTLGIQIIVFSLMKNWTELTNGSLGIAGIPIIHFVGFDFDGKISFLVLSILLMAICWYSLENIAKSGFGKILRGINEDEIYVQSIGKNVYISKVISFTISAVIAAIPGVMYAHYISYIDPNSFTVSESIFILSIVIIGGLRSFKGSFIAAAFLVLLPEVLRFVGLPNNIAANIRQIIYGIILVIVICSRKNGIIGVLRNPGSRHY